MDSVDKILDKHAKVVEKGFVAEGALRYKTYAISTLRGGVGKSTLAFNLAYEMASLARCWLLTCVRSATSPRRSCGIPSMTCRCWMPCNLPFQALPLEIPQTTFRTRSRLTATRSRGRRQAF